MFQLLPKIDTPTSVLEKITAAFCAKEPDMRVARIEFKPRVVRVVCKPAKDSLSFTYPDFREFMGTPDDREGWAVELLRHAIATETISYEHRELVNFVRLFEPAGVSGAEINNAEALRTVMCCYDNTWWYIFRALYCDAVPRKRALMYKGTNLTECADLFRNAYSTANWNKSPYDKWNSLYYGDEQLPLVLLLQLPEIFGACIDADYAWLAAEVKRAKPALLAEIKEHVLNAPLFYAALSGTPADKPPVLKKPKVTDLQATILAQQQQIENLREELRNVSTAVTELLNNLKGSSKENLRKEIEDLRSKVDSKIDLVVQRGHAGTTSAILTVNGQTVRSR